MSHLNFENVDMNDVNVYIAFNLEEGGADLI